jgi:hypothetical protein
VQRLECCPVSFQELDGIQGLEVVSVVGWPNVTGLINYSPHGKNQADRSYDSNLRNSRHSDMRLAGEDSASYVKDFRPDEAHESSRAANSTAPSRA